MSDGRIIERESDGFTFRYYQSAKGTTYAHSDCEQLLKAAQSAVGRWFSRALRTRTTNPAGEQDYELERLRWAADELAEYSAAVQVELDRLEGVDRKTARIKALRAIEGRTPEEAAVYLAKAAQLEATTDKESTP